MWKSNSPACSRSWRRRSDLRPASGRQSKPSVKEPFTRYSAFEPIRISRGERGGAEEGRVSDHFLPMLPQLPPVNPNHFRVFSVFRGQYSDFRVFSVFVPQLPRGLPPSHSTMADRPARHRFGARPSGRTIYVLSRSVVVTSFLVLNGALHLSVDTQSRRTS